MSHIKRVFFDTFGGFADKRIKNLVKGKTFVVDGRSKSNLDSTGRPFATFCIILADVLSDTEVEVRLSGNIPVGKQVKAWLTTNGLKIRDQLTKSLTIKVSPGKQSMLDGLADAMMSIVATGAPWYDEPSYNTPARKRRAH